MSASGGSRRPCNIVVLSDGTGNSSGALFRTNVWRLYKALDLEDRQNPPEPRQFALYDDGVGTSSFKPLALIGGAFGSSTPSSAAPISPATRSTSSGSAAAPTRCASCSG